MATTIPQTLSAHTVCVSVDPSKVRSLVSRLSPCKSLVIINGGCDTGLLGTDWYVLEYMGQYANVVSFDEFIARKSSLPIVIAVTKFILPDNQGAILLHHNEGVYNKDSHMTLFSEFQLCTQGCIIDSTYKGHCGTDYKAGTQWVVTPGDEDSTPYTIPLHLHDALMTFCIMMPTEEDLTTLPIMDLTPDGIWTPSDFNETYPGLSFVDSHFDPPCLAQIVATSVISTTGEDPGASNMTANSIPDIFYNSIPDIFYNASDMILDDAITQDTHPDMDNLYYFDPSDLDYVPDFVGHAFHLTLDPNGAIDSHDVDSFSC